MGPGSRFAWPGRRRWLFKSGIKLPLGYEFRLLAALIRPSLASSCPSKSKRAQGRPGAGWHPRPPVRQVGVRMHRRKTTGVAGYNPAFPAQWFYGLYRALLGDRAVLPPSPRETCFAQLSASVGAPGPHGFAVRPAAARPRKLAAPGAVRPSHPAPRIVTIAMRPSHRGGTARTNHRFLKNRSEIFFARDLDKPSPLNWLAKFDSARTRLVCL